MPLTDDELARLRATQTEAEFDQIFEEIKAARGGQWPSDWVSKIIHSGELNSISMRWRPIMSGDT